MLSRVLLVVVLALAVALPVLSYEVAGKRQTLAGVKLAQQRLQGEKQRLEQARQQGVAAERFMAQASSFVDKAKRLGVRDSEITRYRMDFRQVVETGRIPLLLDQTRSVSGRHYVPRKLEISRDGMNLSSDLKERLKMAQAKREAPYTLAFVGDVLVMSDVEK